MYESIYLIRVSYQSSWSADRQSVLLSVLACSELCNCVCILVRSNLCLILFEAFKCVFSLFNFDIFCNFLLLTVKMSLCGVCNKNVGKNQIKVACHDCNKIFHGPCVNMNKADIDHLVADGLLWRCDPCSLERRKSLRLESTASEGSLTLDDIMKELREIKETQKKNTFDFNQSYDLIYKKVDDANKAVEEQNRKLDEYLKKMEEAELENKQLRKQVEELEVRAEELEQYTRKNCIEIQGVPVVRNEVVLEVVKKVASGIGFTLDDTMVDNCHRLGKKAAGSDPPGIIVKFVRHMDKEEFLRKKKTDGRDMTVRCLGFNADLPIYVNESLSPARRRLLKLARDAKKSKNYKYVWVRGGKILMKKDDTNASSTVVIKKKEDLDEL